MTIISNYHTHSKYCDGKGEMEDYVLAAINAGIRYLGFSSHSPLPLPSRWSMALDDFALYQQTITGLQEKYRDKIKLFTGLEIDYIQGIAQPSSEMFKKLNLDYTLCSIHYLALFPDGKLWNLDSRPAFFEKGIEELFQGDIRNYVETYYQAMSKMLESSAPDIIAHYDYVKINNRGNRYFDENCGWYKEAVRHSLEKIAESESIIEINTGGIGRGFVDSFYPSEWILKQCLELAIPVTVNSDCHHPDLINVFFKEAELFLKRCGYKQIKILAKKGWEDYKF